MKKTDIILLGGIIGTILFSNLAHLESTLCSLEEDVLRIHILANSDSDEDQSLKIKVRDELLSHTEEIFDGCKTLEEMENTAVSNLDYINEIVTDVIAENGFDYGAQSNVVNMEFDERIYGDITMPAGDYEALRITLGEAKGHNWWCVMYPPLCIPAAQEVESDNDKAQEYFSEDEFDVMKNPENYEVKFKCVEIFKGLKKKLGKFF